MSNIYNSSIQPTQAVYDSFNAFIFSDDRVVFNKFCSRLSFYNQTAHLMGDIVECGVFKGSGIMVWLKILDMNEPNSVKKVIGFDHFNRQFIDNLKNKNDREPMEQVFDRCHITDETCFDVVTDKINNAKVNPGKYELIQGDIIETSKGILSRPGLRISILYMDLDLDEPTYATLKNLWSRVVSGGFVIFDEYAYHVWSESNAVDRFVKEYNLKLNSTFIKAPSAYIIKP